MNRRKSLLALIGTVVLLVSLSVPMMQCAPAAEEEVTPPPEEEVAPPPEEEVTPPPEEGEIKYGGRFNVGWAPGTCLENLRATAAWKYTAMGCDFWPLVYDQLWIIGPPPDYKILPRLATSWDMEDGGKTWVFHLRDEGVFHDGVPVTAEDVAFTMKYLSKADPAFSGSFGGDDDPEVTIIDDYTVRITFDKPNAQEFDAAYFVPILPKHIWEPYKDNMTAFDNAEAIGSGPFKVKEFKPAQYIWFEANEDYWGGRPYVDEVVYKTYGSADALYMAVETGEIDMIGYDYCSALAAEDLKEKGFKVIECPGIGLTWLSFNLHKEGPIQDLEVRKAIMYAMDRDRMIDLVGLGYSEKADSWVYPELPEHNPNLPQYDYDPDKAKAILDQGGYIDSDGDGIRNDPTTGKNMEFDLLIASAWTDAVKTGTLIKEQLAEIDIAIDMVVLDLDTFYAYLYTPQDDLYDIAFAQEEPGPYGAWIWEFCRSFEAGGAGWNTSYYYNPELDEILDKLAAEVDQEKRKEYLFDLQMMIAEDLPYGLLTRPDLLNPVSDKFEGYVEAMGLSCWINPWTFFEVHLK